jgi:Fe2+ transport system protein B
MNFSLDLTKPLSRAGLALYLVVIGGLFFCISKGAFHYMSHTLPESSAEKRLEEVTSQAEAKAFAKAKSASKGKAFDEAAAHTEAKKVATEEVAKEKEEIHHHATETWAPFSIFLMILASVFCGGFLSIAVQRRMNDGAVQGAFSLVNHLGAWLVAGYIGFYPYLAQNGLRNSWAVAFFVGLILILPALLAGEGKGHDHDHDHGHDHDHDHGHAH